MTLKQKREIVERFKAGESIGSLVETFREKEAPLLESWRIQDIIRDFMNVLRDFLNGKFKLEKK